MACAEAIRVGLGKIFTPLPVLLISGNEVNDTEEVLSLISICLNISVCVAVGYSENSSACLSMLTSHDNWSSLQMPMHSGMVPVTHTSPSGPNSRYAPFLSARIALTFTSD